MLGAAEGQDAIGEEGEDDGDLQVGVVAFLKAEDSVEGLAEC